MARASSATRLPPLSPSPNELSLSDRARNSPSGTVVGLPASASLRDVTVLSRADWARIQAQLNKPKMEAENAERARKQLESLKKTSEELQTNWDNTLQRRHERRLEERERRLAAEEKERKHLDIEEERLLADRRAELLKRARTQMYYQTDRVKKLHSALAFTEALKEREGQIELRRLKKLNAVDYDKAMIENWQKINDEGIRKDADEAMRRIQAARECRAFQRAQIVGHSRSADEENAQRAHEAEEVNKLQMQYELEKARLARVEREERAVLLEDIKRQIDDVHKMRQIDELREEEDDEDARVFAAAKRKMMQLRYEREKQLAAEKAAQLERIKDKLADQLSRLKSDEEERLTRAIDEAENKFQREEEAKKQRNTKLLKEMDDFRKEKAAQLAKEAAVERGADEAMLKTRLEADHQHHVNELEKARRRRADALDVDTYWKKQIDLERAQRNEEHVSDLERARLEDRLVAEEEKEFQRYASELIDKAKTGGRNTFPLVEAAKPPAGAVGLGPSLPGRTNYLRTDAELNEADGATDAAKEAKLKQIEKNRKRLGFNW